ncbi:hypothetical protein MHU86_22368 [Fragilaria crotonensis]|nr:hypothetical protein MHU86_22368 [Fragilaria crotonensis]
MFALKTLLSLFAFAFVAVVPASAQFAQLSSTISQPVGVIGTGKAVTFNSIDAIQGVTFTSGSSIVTITSAGNYFIVASPQVGFNAATGCAAKTTFTADYWIVVNGVDIANTNVRLTAGKVATDVIVSQGIFALKVNDKVQVFASGTCARSVVIKPPSEPVIPSIIFSIFKF